MWSASTERLNWDRLVLPKMKGGIGLPDIQKYQWVCQLTRIVDWHIHAETKDWITLEDTFSQVLITHMPWIEQKSISSEQVRPTLMTFRTACKKLTLILTLTPGPLIPLDQNSEFPPGLMAHNPIIPGCDSLLRAEQLFLDGQLIPFQNIAPRFPNRTIPFFHYLQIRHFLNRTKPLSKWYRDYTPFEALCTSSVPLRHLISVVYSLLFSDCNPKAKKISQQWEGEVSLDLPKEEWERSYDHIHKGLITVSSQKNGYKIYSRWYRTPEKIHKYHPQVSPQCWRCDTAIAHIWWDCTILQPFWQEVHCLIVRITTYTPDFTPAQYLLHHTSIPYSACKKSLTLHLINAAKQCLPLHWKSPNPPTIADWYPE